MLFPSIETPRENLARAGRERGHRRLSSPRLLRLFALLLLPGLFGAPGAALASPAGQTADQDFLYRHIDTYEDEPWALTPGRYGRVVDVSSDFDGDVTKFVLDDQRNALHVLDASGVPQRVHVLPDDDNLQVPRWRPLRVDVGFDNKVYVLYEGLYVDQETGRALYRTRVDRLNQNAEVEFSFAFEPSEFADPRVGRYIDIAIHPDGRIYLARSAVNAFINFLGCDPVTGDVDIEDAGIDIFTPEGDYLETIHFYMHSSIPWRLDIDSAESLHVINTIPGVLYNPHCTPQPTDQPSLYGEGETVDQDPEPERWPSGVAIFDPDHNLIEIVEFFNAEDIAVGPAGVFISRNVEIFQMRDPIPLYSGPPGIVYAAYFGRIVFNLDVPIDGRVLGAMTHCFYQGVLMFDQPNLRPDEAKFAKIPGTGTDAPELEGPAYPSRIAADKQLGVLSGRYNAAGVPGPNRSYNATSQIVLPQTVQRWKRYSEGVFTPESSPLVGQMGMCAGGRSWFTTDVAVDDEVMYTVDFGQLHRRPDDTLPTWTAFPGILANPESASKLSAVSADDGRIAVLDEASGKVYVLDEDGVTESDFLVAGGGNSVPVDIALKGDRIYLADRGSNRVLIRDVKGRDLGEWPTHDGPESIAVGPEGDVYVLGRGRWGYRYSPEGRMRALWPMPDRSLWSLDLAVDEDGLVYVSFLEYEDYPESTSPGFVTNQFYIRDSGIWIFQPETFIGPPAPVPDPQACTPRTDKWADPYRIPLGDTVDVSLRVDGRCPGRHDPVEIAIVFDTSRSMSFDDGMDRAKDAVSALLDELDPLTSRVALVTFDDGATLEQPLTTNLGDVSLLVSDLDALGDTRSTAGLSVAHRELVDNGRPNVRKVLLFVTDGALKDEPRADAQAARDDGIDLYAIVTPTREYRTNHQQLLQEILGDPSRLISEPDPSEIVRIANDFTNFTPEPGLFETVTVVDEIPSNMVYVATSAKPAAAFDPQANSLTWTFNDVSSAEGMEMTYQLEPQEVGIWPTNVKAGGPYRDAVGSDGALVFPVPVVDVFAPETYAIYLPILYEQKCTPNDKPLDIVLIIDASSSMEEPAFSGGGTKLDAARQAAGAFVGKLVLNPARDNASIVWFNSESAIDVGLTADRGALEAGLSRIKAREGTHIDKGLSQAEASLAASARPEAKPVVILLTDGIHNGNASLEEVSARAASLKARGALIYAIGLGEAIQVELLQNIASSPEGFYRSPTSDELVEIYQEISERLPCDLDGGP
jgi:Mg-chelatase subunit ChlD